MTERFIRTGSANQAARRGTQTSSCAGHRRRAPKIRCNNRRSWLHPNKSHRRRSKTCVLDIQRGRMAVAATVGLTRSLPIEGGSSTRRLPGSPRSSTSSRFPMLLGNSEMQFPARERTFSPVSRHRLSGRERSKLPASRSPSSQYPRRCTGPGHQA